MLAVTVKLDDKENKKGVSSFHRMRPNMKEETRTRSLSVQTQPWY